MKTPEKTNGGANGTATAVKNNSKTNVQTVNRPSIPGKDKDKTDETTKTEPAKGAEAAPAPSAEAKTPANEQQPGVVEQPKGEEVKAEPKEEPKAEVRYIKPALNLEQTVKVVESLNRKNIQRLALIARIKTLEDFQIKLAENGDQLESNVYQGCKLIIEDDKRNQFTTNTPNLIAMVSQFVYDACVNKLAEIESEIVFPAA